MLGENEVIDEPQTTAEENTQAREDAFAAALGNEVRAVEAPTETETTDEVIDDDAADAQVDTASPEEKAGLSTDELTAMLAKVPKIEELENMTNAELRKVHGKLGEFNRVLQELQKAGNSKSEVKIAGLNLKRLQENYPDLAEMLTEDLKDSVGEVKEMQPQINFDERVAQVKADLSKEMQMNLLRIQHRDFSVVAQSDEFKVWAQTLPEDDQKQLADSWDAMYLGEKLTAFKDWKNKKQTGMNERKERLQRAITPTGTQKVATPLPMTREDGFRAALGIK